MVTDSKYAPLKDNSKRVILFDGLKIKTTKAPTKTESINNI